MSLSTLLVHLNGPSGNAVPIHAASRIKHTIIAGTTFPFFTLQYSLVMKNNGFIQMKNCRCVAQYTKTTTNTDTTPKEEISHLAHVTVWFSRANFTWAVHVTQLAELQTNRPINHFIINNN